MPEDTRVPSTDAAALVVVCWRREDGHVVESCPLPPPHADALAQAYARLDPRQQYWVKPVPWLQRPAAPRRRRT